MLTRHSIRKTAALTATALLIALNAYAISFDFDFEGGTEYSGNFTEVFGGTLVAETGHNVQFNGQINDTAAIKYSPSSGFLTESVSFDATPAALNNGSIGMYARVQSNNAAVLAMVNPISATSVRIRLLSGASIATTSIGTTFWDGTFDLAAGTVAMTKGAAGEPTTNAIVAGQALTLILTQTSAANPVFNLTLRDKEGKVASTGNIALTVSGYSTAGAVGVRFNAGPNSSNTWTLDHFWADSDVTVNVDRTTTAGFSNMKIGVTHTEKSLDPSGNGQAVSDGKALLRDAVTYHNQHVMGFGVLNPNPEPGVYSWTSMDKRINMIRDIKNGWTFNSIAHPGNSSTQAVVTMAICPDWMKGGTPGTTTWTPTSWFDKFPDTLAHEDDFAELARVTAATYPDAQYFQVWNEMKGLWNSATNNWDYERYTRAYNKVYNALKLQSPSIKVGGPYMIIEGNGLNTGQYWAKTPISTRNNVVLDYWLANKTGAEFIAIDYGVSRDDPNPTQAGVLARTFLYKTIADQIKLKTTLPIWFAEAYGYKNDPDMEFQRAMMSSCLLHQVKGGVASALLWEPQLKGGTTSIYQSLFTDTNVSGGGQPLPLYAAVKAFDDEFGAGTQLYQSTSSSKGVEVLVSGTKTLLINKRPVPVTVTVLGQTITLARYEVRVL